jgi:hypothetical protein
VATAVEALNAVVTINVAEKIRLQRKFSVIVEYSLCIAAEGCLGWAGS